MQTALLPDLDLVQELRTPLCAVRLSLDHVKKTIGDDAPAAISAHFSLLERNMERMARILDLLEEEEEADVCLFPLHPGPFV